MSNKGYRIAGFAGTALFIIFILCAVYFGITSNISDPAEQGQFGDMFGLANALFSGLAFSGLIYTILLQRNELALQREELQLTRHALESSAKSQKDQASNSSKSIQAQTYFEVIGTINSKENSDQIEVLQELIKSEKGELLKFSEWCDDAKKNANDISNRYQIVAHLVERDFLDKSLFFENFSGTLVHIWRLTAPLISSKRKIASNVLYLRRDLERLALQCWLYQIDLNYKNSILLLDELNNIEILNFTDENISKVKARIKYLERPPQEDTNNMLSKLIV